MSGRHRTWRAAAGLGLLLALLGGIHVAPAEPTPEVVVVDAPESAVEAPVWRPPVVHPPHTPRLRPPRPLEPPEPPTAVETAEPEHALATVSVRFEDADGYVVDDAQGYLRGCEIVGFELHPDGFDAQVEDGELCTAIAMRLDGLLGVRAEPIEFEAVDGIEVMLVFPAERTGGIGVSIQPVETGILVVEVLPGTPAADAGLQPGDVIVSVSGEPAAGMEVEEFIDTMTGPEGSDVEFEVEFEADTGLTISSMRLTRAFLSG